MNTKYELWSYDLATHIHFYWSVMGYDICGAKCKDHPTTSSRLGLLSFIKLFKQDHEGLLP